MNQIKGNKNFSISSIIQINLNSEKNAKIVFKVLTPEVKSQLGRRALANIEQEDSQILLKIFAKDKNSFRATMNSFLRWIDGTISIIELFES